MASHPRRTAGCRPLNSCGAAGSEFEVNFVNAVLALVVTAVIVAVSFTLRHVQRRAEHRSRSAAAAAPIAAKAAAESPQAVVVGATPTPATAPLTGAGITFTFEGVGLTIGNRAILTAISGSIPANSVTGACAGACLRVAVLV